MNVLREFRDLARQSVINELLCQGAEAVEFVYIDVEVLQVPFVGNYRTFLNSSAIDSIALDEILPAA
jgi:hypothetical protein